MDAERRRVVVTRALADERLEALRTIADVWTPPHDHTLSREELLAALPGAHVVVCTLHDRIDGEALDAAGENLGLVSTISAGTDHLDLAALSERGIGVASTPGALTAATADLTIGLILSVTRRISEGDRMVRAGTPWRWDLSFMLGDSLEGATLGIIGLGQIGSAVAHRARAFGMTIVASPSHSGAHRDDIPRLELDDLLSTVDVVSLHCPLTAETRHLIDERRLGLMKPTAYLINTARGPIVDEAALARALATGALRGAGLDVYEEEPRVYPDLRELPNVVLAPHLGSATVTTRLAMIDQAVASARAYVLNTAAGAPAG